jgi:hypothetical protein
VFTAAKPLAHFFDEIFSHLGNFFEACHQRRNFCRCRSV